MKSRKRHFLRSTEGIIFLAGCLLFANTIVLLSFSKPVKPELMQKILSMIAVDFFSGHQGGIYYGIVAGIPLFYIVIISTLYNLIYMSILYPLITYFYERIIKMKIVGSAVKSTRAIAQKNLSKVERYGALGVGVFIWLPFYMTGPLIGALLGYLIGLRTSMVLLVTVISTIASALSWSLLFEQIFRLIREMGKTIPAISVGIILAVAFYLHLKKLLKPKKYSIEGIKKTLERG
jgi:uncharacterized membrane protein